MSKGIDEADEMADKRYYTDYIGIVYTSVYAAIASVTGGAAMNIAGVVATQGLPLAMTLVFVTYVLPKIAQELDRRHRLNEAKREGYMAGRLESRKGTTNLFSLLFFGVVSKLGKCSNIGSRTF